MGNFYTNYTLRGPSQEDVAAALAGRDAIVTPEHNGCVVVFDEESEAQDPEIIAELATHLSGRFLCPLLVVTNHDDDILFYQLFLNGELTDEYDSTPDYFEGGMEGADHDPEGGDTEKLCAAFGVKRTKRVEKILRKAAFDGDAYAFAVERHGDLAEALGLPSFSVGMGYRSVATGELSDEVPEGELVKTKDLTPPSAPQNENAAKPLPGYYKISFRAHPALTKSIPSCWMPNLWTELQCSKSDLSQSFHQATDIAKNALIHLGFSTFGFLKLGRVLNPDYRDGGSVHFWDESRCYFARIIYNKFYSPAQKTEQEKVVIAFAAVFPEETVTCTNDMFAFDPLPKHRVFRIQSDNAAVLYQHFFEQLKQDHRQPRSFPDSLSFQNWFDSQTYETFADRVQRGIWVRMSDYEVAVAHRKLPPTR